MRPNILYLHSHDTGRYIQPYGYAVPTPNLQRLAEQGVLFRQAFCAGAHLLAQPRRAADRAVRPQPGMIGLAHRGFRAATIIASTSCTPCARRAIAPR